MSPGRRIAGRGLPRSPGPVRIDAMTEPLPRAADAEHITEVLRRSGAKGLARVSNVAVTSSLKKLRSHTLRLHLDYESSTPDVPSSLRALTWMPNARRGLDFIACVPHAQRQKAEPNGRTSVVGHTLPFISESLHLRIEIICSLANPRVSFSNPSRQEMNVAEKFAFPTREGRHPCLRLRVREQCSNKFFDRQSLTGSDRPTVLRIRTANNKSPWKPKVTISTSKSF
jgi:hypothetical protein